MVDLLLPPRELAPRRNLAPRRDLAPYRDHARLFTATRPQSVGGPAYHPRIFVVDDNPGEIGVLTEAFAIIDGAAEIDTCTSAQLAMVELVSLASRAGGMLPDLVVLDIHMPLISGPDLLRGMRAQQELDSVAVAMITGAANMLERGRCIQLGALAVFDKPFTFAGYLGLARRLMGLARESGSANRLVGDAGIPGSPPTTL